MYLLYIISTNSIIKYYMYNNLLIASILFLLIFQRWPRLIVKKHFFNDND